MQLFARDSAEVSVGFQFNNCSHLQRFSWSCEFSGLRRCQFIATANKFTELRRLKHNISLVSIDIAEVCQILSSLIKGDTAVTREF